MKNKSGDQQPLKKRGAFRITLRVGKFKTEKKMKKIIKNLSKGLFILMLFFATSCSLSTNELAEEVKVSMNETWEKEGITGIKIESFFLTHKGGNECSGILEANEEGEKFKYTVKVIYDGENMQWEIIE